MLLMVLVIDMIYYYSFYFVILSSAKTLHWQVLFVNSTKRLSFASSFILAKLLMILANTFVF